MSEIEADTNKIDTIVHKAWQLLQQKKPADACHILAPWVQHTQTNQAVAEVWAAMLGYVEEEEAYLIKEVKRMAYFWTQEARIVILLAQAILQWRVKQNTLQDVARPDGLIALVIEVVNLCLTDAAPSDVQQRAQLYNVRAQLLSYGDMQAEELALESFEIALSLHAQPQMWYHLARLHFVRARWHKSVMSCLQALHMGLDAKPLYACMAWALNARGLGQEEILDHQNSISIQDQVIEQDQELLVQVWKQLEHDELHFHPQQKRYVFNAKVDPILVAIHTHMVSPGGHYDLEAQWAEEIVWVQPMSPCHGRILHPPITLNVVGFDDLIVWDAQPALFEEIEGEEQVIMKAVACLQKGKAHTRLYPKPKLSAEQLTTLNEHLPSGCFYYQSPAGPDQHGALCWPRQASMSLQKLLQQFEAIYEKIK